MNNMETFPRIWKHYCRLHNHRSNTDACSSCHGAAKRPREEGGESLRDKLRAVSNATNSVAFSLSSAECNIVCEDLSQSLVSLAHETWAVGTIIHFCNTQGHLLPDIKLGERDANSTQWIVFVKRLMDLPRVTSGIIAMNTISAVTRHWNAAHPDVLMECKYDDNTVRYLSW